MPEEDKKAMGVINDLPVTMIGVRTEGTGAPITDGQVVVTPAGQPNLVVSVISPLAAISVRFANAYLTTLIGLVTAAVTTDAIPYTDFAQLVIKCAGLSLAGPCIALGKDIITILGNLEKKFPLLTGSV